MVPLHGRRGNDPRLGVAVDGVPEGEGLGALHGDIVEADGGWLDPHFCYEMAPPRS